MSEDTVFDYSDDYEEEFQDVEPVAEPEEEVASTSDQDADLLRFLNRFGPAVSELPTLEEKIVKVQKALGVEPDGSVEWALSVLAEKE